MSWNWPALVNRIASDVPFIQKALNALLKQDPTSIKDIPAGAKRLTEVSSGNWQVQQYNGTSWNNIGKLKMDVDTVDGYHAAITPTANTIAVRNKQSKLEGDITGNAATASSAVTLSKALAVNKGGTGATTSAEARTNLGVPPTSHASSTTTYGVATDTNYGHVRSDRKTTKISSGEVIVKDVAIGGNVGDLAGADRGAFGYAVGIAGGWTDFGSKTLPGFYHGTIQEGCADIPPGMTVNDNLFVRVLGNWNSSSNSGTVRQFAFRNHTGPNQAAQLFMRHIAGKAGVNTTDWVRFITSEHIGSGLSMDSNTGVVSVHKYQGATSTLNGIAGLVPPAAKGQHDKEFLRGDGTWAVPSAVWFHDHVDGIPTTGQWITLAEACTSSGSPIGSIQSYVDRFGAHGIAINAGDSVKGNQGIKVTYTTDSGTFSITGITPPSSSNGIDIPTTAWVRNLLNTATVGTTWKQLGNRGTTGTWTITGVKANVPLFIIAVRNTTSNNPHLVPFGSSGNTGFISATTAINGLVIADGSSHNFSNNNIVVLPTSTSVSIYIQINVAFTLYAYQTQ